MDLKHVLEQLNKGVDRGARATLPTLHFGARHFFTIGSVLVVGALGLFTPQITHLFELPSTSKVPWRFALGFYAYVAFVSALFLGLGWRVVSVSEPRIRILRLLALPIDWLINLPAALASKLSQHGRHIVAGSLGLVGVLLLVWNVRRDVGSTIVAASPLLTLGWLGILFAAWFRWTVKHPFQSAGRHPSPTDITARFFACTLVSIAVCEFVWFLANTCSPYFSFRLYSICAVMELGFVVILGARYTDFLQIFLWPYSRLVAALLVGLFLLKMPRDSVGRTAPSPAPATAESQVAAATEKWFGTLRSRLDRLPEDGPVIVVSASGGGSRAALFTGLVLEALANTPSGAKAAGDAKAPATFGDHIALISSVSGGSLATAYYAYPPPSPNRVREDLENTTYAELVAYIKKHSEELREQLEKREAGGSAGIVVHAMSPSAGPREADTDEFTKQLRQTIDLCQSLPEDPGGWKSTTLRLPVPLLSAFADDMCTDFMAPVLRGTLLWGSRRGENLTAFWEEHFSWQNFSSTSSGGADKPLLLFNATDADRGTPFVVGFPPLPPGLLPARMASLSELDPGYQLTLGEAVRVSSNFPWLVQVASLEPNRNGAPIKLTFASEVEAARPIAPPADRSNVDLLDGGVVDNSGLDTLASLLQRLVLFASGETPAIPETKDPEEARRLQDQATRIQGHASQILKTLQERGLLLVEIDSGAKKKSISSLGHLLPTLLEPVEALFVAGSMNERYRHKQRLKELFQVLAEDDPEPTRTAYVPFSLDRLHQVMTSWALGPSDKAKVWVNFLIEFKTAGEDLRKTFDALAKRDSEAHPAPAEELKTIQEEVEDNAAKRAKFRQSAEAK